MPKSVVFCGEKNICLNCIKYVANRKDCKITGVFASENDWEANIPKFCSENNIPAFQGHPNEYLLNEDYDVIFSIQERRKLSRDIINRAKIGAYNLHFGKLPEYRGCHPIAHQILNKEKYICATLHEMTENFDDGNIIEMTGVYNHKYMTAKEAHIELGYAAYSLFVSYFDAMLNNEYYSSKQDIDKAVYYKKDAIDFEKDSIIDINDKDFLTKVKAFTFPPFQYPRIAVNGSVTKFKIVPEGEESEG